MDIESLKNKINIVEVIGSYIPLKKTGINYQSCCPFHSEKSPSFVVSEQKQIFKCFGCGESGDALKFIQKYKNIDFKDALSYLCETYNLPNPLTQEKHMSEHKILSDKLKTLSEIFTNNLLAQSEIALKLRSYLQRRGFTQEDIKKNSFGYCKGDEWQSLFTMQEAQKVGIININGYCLFTNRLTITLFSKTHKVIGFVGRTHQFFNFRNSPKYINSKENFLYSKSKNFYNFSTAYPHIVKSGKVLIVEGYFDALAAHKMNIKNCIATGGTAFNKTFLAQLSQVNPEITFLFDNDEAGQKNTLSALRVCIENGFINIYKGILRQNAKDLGEVLEKGLEPNIRKIDGVRYYLKASLNALKDARAKDEFFNNWKNFIFSQENHFLKLELIEKTKQATGIDVKIQKQEPQANDILEQVFTSIINSKECAYLASGLITGEELGAFEASYKNFLLGKSDVNTQNALFKSDSTLNLYQFSKALRFIAIRYYEKLIERAKNKKDYTLARNLANHKQNLYLKDYELV